MYNTRKLLGGLVTSLVLTTVSATAATVDLVSVNGAWTEANPASAISGIGGELIEWGTPTGATDPSGYLFDGASGLPVGLIADTDFNLGTFTHFNNSLTGSSTTLDTAELTVEIGIQIDGGATQFIQAIFDFKHLETPNGASPCADGGEVPVGVNVNGCADRVTAVTNAAFSETFEVDGDIYVFDFTAFQYDGKDLIEFWTTEGQSNEAFLQARYTLRENIDPEPVPLPAAGWLLLAALGGLRLAKRRS